MTKSVLIVGAGLVGGCMALGLANLGFQVSVVERQPLPPPAKNKLGWDLRQVALSPASRDLLDSLGVWSKQILAPYTTMRVWEQWGSAELNFSAAEIGRQELGWVVEQSALVSTIWSAMADHGDIEVLIGDVERIAPSESSVEVSMVNDSSVEKDATHAALTFDFVIGADGARSMVRTSLDVEVKQYPADQVALATLVAIADDHQATAWQCFLEDGPVALLPTPDANKCSVVWSQSDANAQRRLALSDEAFCAELSTIFADQVGPVVAVDKRVCFPLVQQSVTSCYPHHRALLLGDAMRVVHPLAGLGVNLGFEDVRGVLDVAKNIARRGEPLGSPGTFKRFARHRQTRSRMMIAAMAGLQETYAAKSPVAALVRNTGVNVINQFAPAKHQIMREALGLGPLAQLS